MSHLLVLEALQLLACLAVSLYYGENCLSAFAVPIGVSLLIGVICEFAGRGAENRIGRREACLIVSLTWLVFSAIGMLPFIVSGAVTRIPAAFREALSGFTTTGATVLTNIDSLPRGLLFWRSMTHWFGGMGIVFFTIAVLPTMGNGDLRLFSAETTGLKMEKIHPRISTTARWLWGLYICLTVACTLGLYLSGMGLFDAINHSMSTVATGGFSTHQDSIAWFHSPAVEYVETIFMFLSGINFTLLYLFFIKRRWRDVWNDGELRCYVLICLATVAFCSAWLYFSGKADVEESVRTALFHTVSLQSTTGLTSTDLMTWNPSTWLLLFFVMAVGGCAGSTSGGIKCVRIFTSWKIFSNELRHILHPRAVIPVRIGGMTLREDVGHTIFAFFAAFFILVFTASITMMCMGMPMLDAVSLSITSFSNVGPAFGHAVGPLDSWGHLPDGVLWVNSFMMLAGRLEIFSLLLPFTVGFWREQ